VTPVQTLPATTILPFQRQHQGGGRVGSAGKIQQNRAVVAERSVRGAIGVKAGDQEVHNGVPGVEGAVAGDDDLAIGLDGHGPGGVEQAWANDVHAIHPEGAVGQAVGREARDEGLAEGLVRGVDLADDHEFPVGLEGQVIQPVVGDGELAVAVQRRVEIPIWQIAGDKTGIGMRGDLVTRYDNASIGLNRYSLSCFIIPKAGGEPAIAAAETVVWCAVLVQAGNRKITVIPNF
jgi:hypothetical protein